MSLIPIKYTYVGKNFFSVEQKRVITNISCRGKNILCCFCGNTYKKLNFCVIHNNNNKNIYKQCCQLCFIVNCYCESYSKMVTVCESSMSQIDIIQATTKYIIENNNIPSPCDIDKKCHTINLHPNIFFRNINEVDNYDNYRIFYTQFVDIPRITINYGISNKDCSLFDDEISTTKNNTAVNIEHLIRKNTKDFISRINEKINRHDKLAQELNTQTQLL